MGLEYRTFALLADGDELKAREVALNDLPRTKDGEYLPHEALLGKDETVKISKEVLLFYPHDNVTEVRFVNPGKKLGPLVVRMVLEKTESMCERYGDEVTSESARDMIEFLRACGTAVPSTLTTIQLTQTQRLVKFKVGDKKVKLEYTKLSVVVQKTAHGRGTAGSLSETWVTTCARGSATAVESLVPSLRHAGKSLAAASRANVIFPTFLEVGFAEFVARMAARVKPPTIPMAPRKKKEVPGADGATAADADGKEKKSKKQKANGAEAGAGGGMGAVAAELVMGFTELVQGAAAAMPQGMISSASKAESAEQMKRTLGTMEGNLAASGRTEAMASLGEDSNSDDQDDEPITKFMPVRKKPGPKPGLKAERAAIAAAAAAEAVLTGAMVISAPELPVNERKKPGPKSKKDKAALEAAAGGAAGAATAGVAAEPAKEKKKPGPKSKKDKAAVEAAASGGGAAGAAGAEAPTVEKKKPSPKPKKDKAAVAPVVAPSDGEKSSSDSDSDDDDDKPLASKLDSDSGSDSDSDSDDDDDDDDDDDKPLSAMVNA